MISDLSDFEVLLLTIIGESRGEPIEGQVAVGNVIRNRVRTHKQTYKEICLKPKQFSCWNENDPNRVLLEELGDQLSAGLDLDISYNQCVWVAIGIMHNKLHDNTHGALNYITLDLWNSSNKPSWAHNVTSAISKGSQIFFRA